MGRCLELLLCVRRIDTYFFEDGFGRFVVLDVFVDLRFADVERRAVVTEQRRLAEDHLTVRLQRGLIVDEAL